LTASIQPASATSRGAAIAAAVIVLICLFSHQGSLGLVGPDEPRYAWIARNMAATGDWVTPKLYGQPWLEKPVLYYWAAALGFAAHLPDEWAARLPSALAALAAAAAIGWLGWKHCGFGSGVSSPALLGPLLFSTTVGAIGFARAAGPDMLFAGALMLAMASATGVLRTCGSLRQASESTASQPGRDWPSLACFGASLGLAVLAKGPAGLILAVAAVAVWAIATRQWRAALRLTHPVVIAAWCVVALPWYVLCALRNPNFLRVFLLEHNFERYVAPVFHHRQPSWFFLPILLLALFPWTALLFPAALEGFQQWREKSWIRSPGFFFACWAAAPVVFFSFSQSKLPGYILPAVPPAALLLGVTLARLLRSDSALRRWMLAVLGASWILAGAVAPRAANLPVGARDTLGKELLPAAIVAIAAGCAVCTLSAFRVRAALWCCLLLAPLFVEIAGLRFLPRLDPYISARYHEEMLRNDRRLDRLFTFRLQRSWSYGLAFYLNRPVPEWSSSDPEGALVLTTPEGLVELKQLGRFHGTLEEEYVGILYVPVGPATH